MESSQQLGLDVWLDVACVYKTRSEAQRACRGGKVTVNGARAKPHREIQAGDRIAITTRSGPKRRLVVMAITGHHIPKAEARSLYNDVTPPPTPNEAEFQELLRRTGHAPGARQGAPSRRDRRLRRDMKGRI